MIGFAFYVSCLNFYKGTRFSPEKIVRHYCGNGENPNDENILKEGISWQLKIPFFYRREKTCLY
jgi:hypothetical protein